jgi:hypothetical protein
MTRGRDWSPKKQTSLSGLVKRGAAESGERSGGGGGGARWGDEPEALGECGPRCHVGPGCQFGAFSVTLGISGRHCDRDPNLVFDRPIDY